MNTIVSSLVESVCRQMNFTSDQRLQLAVYPDKIVNMAFEMTKGRKFNDKFHGWNFINSVVRKEFAKQTTSGSDYTGLSQSSNNSVEEKKQLPWADMGINPSIDLSHEDNLAYWNSYEQSDVVQDYIEAVGQFGVNVIKNRKRDFIAKLEKHIPENLVIWRRRAKEYQKGDLSALAEMFKIKPESTTLNNIPQEQPNTQAKEKDSTDRIVVDISKYKDPQQLKEIKDWLATVTYGDNKTVKAVIEEPEYNPFDQIEELDSTLFV
jgi:hypothetical protein